MSYKRSRTAFEEELQAQQSPFVVYGTPLPPLDPAVRDDGSYVPVWKQEVTDERGRKRLHGAFTGGFSAGYFNTVGSKEGWTPATFVSSKSKRKDGATVQQKPEDFMDDEDLAEAEESKKLATTDAFNALGSTANEVSTRGGLTDLFQATGDTMGLKLLRKMGWRDGQGIGPKVRRKAKVNGDDEGGEEGEQGETHLFAPEDSKMISFVRKNDYKGLGFEDQERLEDGFEREKVKSMEDSSDDGIPSNRKIKSKLSSKPQRGGFGVGVLNDNGSDDDDPYHVGPQISYNRVIGGDKKKKKKAAAKPSANNANPLLRAKPIFISKKAALNSASFRKCHDGRLALSGFVLSNAPLTISANSHPPPVIPADWKPATTANSGSSNTPTTLSTAQQALTPSARSAILGEAPLPSKSVFSYLKPSARDRISHLTNNAHLPPALSELPPPAAQATAAEKAADQVSLIPHLDPATAAAALSGGFLPYGDDAPKRARYLAFLDLRAHSRLELPHRRDDTSADEWIAELREFADAARIFRPAGGAMANRFTTSAAAARTSNIDAATPDETSLLLTTPTPKPADPAEEAARMGMFGRLTRRTEQWAPNRLLCKRFNVRVPEHVAPDDVTGGGSGKGARNAARNDDALDGRFKAGGVQTSEREGAVRDATAPPPPPPKKDRELLGKHEMEELRASARAMGIGVAEADDETATTMAMALDPGRNEALESQKAGEAVFRAIFGDDSEDE